MQVFNKIPRISVLSGNTDYLLFQGSVVAAPFIHEIIPFMLRIFEQAFGNFYGCFRVQVSKHKVQGVDAIAASRHIGSSRIETCQPRRLGTGNNTQHTKRARVSGVSNSIILSSDLIFKFGYYSIQIYDYVQLNIFLSFTLNQFFNSV